METFSWQLTQQWRGDKTVIARGKRQADVFWVAPVLLYHAWRLRKTADVYHLGDAVLAPLAPFIRRFTGKPVVVTVHGLELTYNTAGAIFHRLIHWGMGSVNHFVCVSAFTSELLRKRSIANENISVIGHGVIPPTHLPSTRALRVLPSGGGSVKAEQQFDALAEQRFLLLTVGRLVKRKGVEWFIRNVMPKIQNLNPLYLVTSTGPEQEHIRQTIAELHLENSVQLLGTVDPERLEQLFSSADIFIMPNIPVPHDVEGFGFVALEAAVHATPVIAARLEGIPDAIHDKKNGMLFTPGNAEECATLITHWHDHPEERLTFGEQAQAYTVTHFRWEDVVERYAQLFATLP